MKYALLIYSAEVPADQVKPEVWAQVMEEYNAYTKMLNDTGVNTDGGEALHETKTAKSVRISNGKKNITDGPFAETKEALGGFYIVDVKDMDEAVNMPPSAQAQKMVRSKFALSSTLAHRNNYAMLRYQSPLTVFWRNRSKLADSQTEW